jgi:hypothetical protein
MQTVPSVTLTPAVAPVTRPNKRATRRQSPKGNVKVRAYKSTLGLGPNIAVSILDVSEMGIRLLLKESLPIGHAFEVSLESVSCKPIKTIAEIVWSVPAADGTFCVGARFQKSIPYRDLALVARL